MPRFVLSISSPSSPFSHGLIPIELKLHAEARNIDEDWSGKGSTRDRRKLQNRLNQRAYRRRKTAEHQSRAQTCLSDEAASDSSQSVCAKHGPASDNPTAFDLEEDQTYSTTPCTDGFSNSPSQLGLAKPVLHTICHQRANEAPSTIPLSWCRDLERSLANLGLDEDIESTQKGNSPSSMVLWEEGYLSRLDPETAVRTAYQPLADHLLSLMYYNVFRALVRNVESLSLNMTLMHTDTYPSPFIPNPINAIQDLNTIPPQFKPTLIQRTVPHHPCFDIFPDPVLRDNAILNSSRLGHGRLCLTLAGRETWHEKYMPRRNGMVIWGDPDNAAAWEVTEGFARNWPWLVKGSWGLQASSNTWRQLRGEPPICFA